MKLDDFEGVFAVCFTGYKDRHARLLVELERVGLRSKTQIVWQFPSPYYKWFSKRVPHDPFLDAFPGCWGACNG